jgi:hypothetical protein
VRADARPLLATLGRCCEVHRPNNQPIATQDMLVIYSRMLTGVPVQVHPDAQTTCKAICHLSPQPPGAPPPRPLEVLSPRARQKALLRPWLAAWPPSLASASAWR